MVIEFGVQLQTVIFPVFKSVFSKYNKIKIQRGVGLKFKNYNLWCFRKDFWKFLEKSRTIRGVKKNIEIPQSVIEYWVFLLTGSSMGLVMLSNHLYDVDVINYRSIKLKSRRKTLSCVVFKELGENLKQQDVSPFIYEL